MVLGDASIPVTLLCDGHDAADSNSKQLQLESNKHMQDVLWALSYGMGEVRLQAAREIRKLTKTSARSRVYLAAAGAITPLVSMLKVSSAEVKEAALLALLNLAVRNERNKMRITKAGAIGPLVELLRSGQADLRESAAAAILTLSAADANKPVIGTSGAIPLLVDMLTTASIQGKVDAVIALSNLSTHAENVVSILKTGAGAPLILLLKDCKKSSKVAEKVMALLESLISYEEGRCSAVRESGGLLAIVEVLEEGSVQGREHAVGALLTMCQSNRRKYRETILQEGVIPGLLELTVQGTPSAQEKAKKLLELLRDSSQSQRSGHASPSASAVLESMFYDIAAHIEDAEVGAETTKRVLSEMVQLSREQSTQQRVMAYAPSDVSHPSLTTKAFSK
ncbi:hypothetical protein GOP47_0010598 [Adiantum capillus-veneris]|uniref:U-box domain-containing protein n=1 Tax=Adiantum capillus-veneris TaxID=13818 RepID=A0A9D4UWB8_ADICA|nr:hypothetical protein GOP47_0010598 [Adiantum capillus-veneris]